MASFAATEFKVYIDAFLAHHNLYSLQHVAAYLKLWPDAVDYDEVLHIQELASLSTLRSKKWLLNYIMTPYPAVTELQELEILRQRVEGMPQAYTHAARFNDARKVWLHILELEPNFVREHETMMLPQPLLPQPLDTWESAPEIQPSQLPNPGQYSAENGSWLQMMPQFSTERILRLLGLHLRRIIAWHHQSPTDEAPTPTAISPSLFVVRNYEGDSVRQEMPYEVRTASSWDSASSDASPTAPLEPPSPAKDPIFIRPVSIDIQYSALETHLEHLRSAADFDYVLGDSSRPQTPIKRWLAQLEEALRHRQPERCLEHLKLIEQQVIPLDLERVIQECEEVEAQCKRVGARPVVAVVSEPKAGATTFAAQVSGADLEAVKVLFTGTTSTSQSLSQKTGSTSKKGFRASSSFSPAQLPFTTATTSTAPTEIPQRNWLTHLRILGHDPLTQLDWEQQFVTSPFPTPTPRIGSFGVVGTTSTIIADTSTHSDSDSHEANLANTKWTLDLLSQASSVRFLVLFRSFGVRLEEFKNTIDRLSRFMSDPSIFESSILFVLRPLNSSEVSQIDSRVKSLLSDQTMSAASRILIEYFLRQLNNNPTFWVPFGTVEEQEQHRNSILRKIPSNTGYISRKTSKTSLSFQTLVVVKKQVSLEYKYLEDLIVSLGAQCGDIDLQKRANIARWRLDRLRRLQALIPFVQTQLTSFDIYNGALAVCRQALTTLANHCRVTSLLSTPTIDDINVVVRGISNLTLLEDILGCTELQSDPDEEGGHLCNADTHGASLKRELLVTINTLQKTFEDQLKDLGCFHASTTTTLSILVHSCEVATLSLRGDEFFPAWVRIGREVTEKMKASLLLESNVVFPGEATPNPSPLSLDIDKAISFWDQLSSLVLPSTELRCFRDNQKQWLRQQVLELLSAVSKTISGLLMRSPWQAKESEVRLCLQIVLKTVTSTRCIRPELEHFLTSDAHKHFWADVVSNVEIYLIKCYQFILDKIPSLSENGSTISRLDQCPPNSEGLVYVAHLQIFHSIISVDSSPILQEYEKLADSVFQFMQRFVRGFRCRLEKIFSVCVVTLSQARELSLLSFLGTFQETSEIDIIRQIRQWLEEGSQWLERLSFPGTQPSKIPRYLSEARNKLNTTIVELFEILEQKVKGSALEINAEEPIAIIYMMNLLCSVLTQPIEPAPIAPTLVPTELSQHVNNVNKWLLGRIDEEISIAQRIRITDYHTGENWLPDFQNAHSFLENIRSLLPPSAALFSGLHIKVSGELNHLLEFAKTYWANFQEIALNTLRTLSSLNINHREQLGEELADMVSMVQAYLKLELQEDILAPAREAWESVVSSVRKKYTELSKIGFDGHESTQSSLNVSNALIPVEAVISIPVPFSQLSTLLNQQLNGGVRDTIALFKEALNDALYQEAQELVVSLPETATVTRDRVAAMQQYLESRFIRRASNASVPSRLSSRISLIVPALLEAGVQELLDESQGLLLLLHQLTQPDLENLRNLTNSDQKIKAEYKLAIRTLQEKFNAAVIQVKLLLENQDHVKALHMEKIIIRSRDTLASSGIEIETDSIKEVQGKTDSALRLLVRKVKTTSPSEYRQFWNLRTLDGALAEFSAETRTTMDQTIHHLIDFVEAPVFRLFVLSEENLKSPEKLISIIENQTLGCSFLPTPAFVLIDSSTQGYDPQLLLSVDIFQPLHRATRLHLLPGASITILKQLMEQRSGLLSKDMVDTIMKSFSNYYAGLRYLIRDQVIIAVQAIPYEERNIFDSRIQKAVKTLGREAKELLDEAFQALDDQEPVKFIEAVSKMNYEGHTKESAEAFHRVSAMGSAAASQLNLALQFCDDALSGTNRPASIPLVLLKQVEFFFSLLKSPANKNQTSRNRDYSRRTSWARSTVRRVVTVVSELTLDESTFDVGAANAASILAPIALEEKTNIPECLQVFTTEIRDALSNLHAIVLRQLKSIKEAIVDPLNPGKLDISALQFAHKLLFANPLLAVCADKYRNHALCPANLRDALTEWHFIGRNYSNSLAESLELVLQNTLTLVPYHLPPPAPSSTQAPSSSASRINLIRVTEPTLELPTTPEHWKTVLEHLQVLTIAQRTPELLRLDTSPNSLYVSQGITERYIRFFSEFGLALEQEAQNATLCSKLGIAHPFWAQVSTLSSSKLSRLTHCVSNGDWNLGKWISALIVAPRHHIITETNLLIQRLVPSDLSSVAVTIIGLAQISNWDAISIILQEIPKEPARLKKLRKLLDISDSGKLVIERFAASFSMAPLQ